MTVGYDRSFLIMIYNTYTKLYYIQCRNSICRYLYFKYFHHKFSPSIASILKKPYIVYVCGNQYSFFVSFTGTHTREVQKTTLQTEAGWKLTYSSPASGSSVRSELQCHSFPRSDCRTSSGTRAAADMTNAGSWWLGYAAGLEVAVFQSCSTEDILSAHVCKEIWQNYTPNYQGLFIIYSISLYTCCTGSTFRILWMFLLVYGYGYFILEKLISNGQPH